MKDSGKSVEDLLKDEFFVQWVIRPTEDSNYYWEQWLANHPSQKETLQKALQIIKSLDYSAKDEMSQNEKDQILNKLVAYLRTEKDKSIDKSSSFTFLRRYAAAASILVISLLTVSMFYLIENNQKEVVLSSEPERIVKTVPFGQKNIIKFLDGSEVKLNAGSTMSFISGFEPEKRVVNLQGEAFFDVAKDENRPFFINSGNAQVKVTGTSFNVKAFENENEIKIAVVSGSVEINFVNGKQAKLEKNEMAIYNNQINSVSIQSYNYDQEIGWKDGMLIFDQDNLQQVLLKLQRWYGVEVSLKEKNVAGLYNGEFENASLEMVMEGISFAYGFEYTINGKTVELK